MATKDQPCLHRSRNVSDTWEASLLLRCSIVLSQPVTSLKPNVISLKFRWFHWLPCQQVEWYTNSGNVQPSNPLPKLWIELVSWTPSKWCQQISRHPTNTAQGGRFLSCTSPPQICTFDGQPARMWQNKSAGGIANTWCLATMRVAYWERPQGWYSNISCHEHEVQNILAPSTQATVFPWLVRVMPSGFRNCTIYQTFGTTQIRLFICNLSSTKCMIWSHKRLGNSSNSCWEYFLHLCLNLQGLFSIRMLKNKDLITHWYLSRHQDLSQNPRGVGKFLGIYPHFIGRTRKIAIQILAWTFQQGHFQQYLCTNRYSNSCLHQTPIHSAEGQLLTTGTIKKGSFLTFNGIDLWNHLRTPQHHSFIEASMTSPNSNVRTCLWITQKSHRCHQGFFHLRLWNSATNVDANTRTTWQGFTTRADFRSTWSCQRWKKCKAAKDEAVEMHHAPTQPGEECIHPSSRYPRERILVWHGHKRIGKQMMVSWV